MPPRAEPSWADHDARPGVLLLAIGQAVAADVEQVEVITEDGIARIRLIGIDTPEVGSDGEPGECNVEEARDYLDALSYSQAVELRSDPAQHATDTYSRLLRHVFIDGQTAAVLAIQDGAGNAYTYEAAYAGRRERWPAENDRFRQPNRSERRRARHAEERPAETPCRNRFAPKRLWYVFG